MLSAIPPGLFRPLRFLNFLDLSESRLNELPWGVFDSLSRLRELEMTGRGFLSAQLDLRELRPGVFDALTSLENLVMSRNWNLQPLHPRIFSKLTRLRELTLAGMPVASASFALPGFFNNMPRLYDLGIEGSVLNALPTLPSMPEMELVSYFSAFLRRIPRTFFANWPRLSHTDGDGVRRAAGRKQEGPGRSQRRMASAVAGRRPPRWYAPTHTLFPPSPFRSDGTGRRLLLLLATGRRRV